MEHLVQQPFLQIIIIMIMMMMICITIVAMPASSNAAMAASNLTTSAACGTRDCGEGIRIAYPFGIGRGCGHPDFDGLLRCNPSDGTLNLTTPSGPFQVQSIFYPNRTLTLSIGSSPSVPVTPSTPTNSSHTSGVASCYSFLRYSGFSLPASGPLSAIDTTFLVFNCPPNSSTLASPAHFCNFTDQDLYSAWRDCAPLYDGPMLAMSSACVHHSNPSVSEILDPAYLPECPALMFTSMYNLNGSPEEASFWSYGIQLQWKDPLKSSLCTQCETSGGTCGYNLDPGRSFTCICAHRNTSSSCNQESVPTASASQEKARPSLILEIALPATLCLSVVLLCLAIWSWRKLRHQIIDEKGSGLDAAGDSILDDGIIQRFSYKQLVTATSNFKFELGRGGYGVVYRGILPATGEEVAVKVLDGSQQADETFQSEVAILGSINHVNLVKLYGYCLEGNKRILVYEYMSNLSLEKYISAGDNRPSLDLETRYSIALQAARALEYLHEGCRRHIVHCDIKPENILLDSKWRAKVADFGMAKLMGGEESLFQTSRVRGTYGYMAPEWSQGGAITKKADVYSFGIVLLQVVSGQQPNADGYSVVEWARQKLQQEQSCVLELLDQRLSSSDNINEINEDQVKVLVQVALWCVQEHPSQRPSMTHVVKMMEGTMQVPSIQIQHSRASISEAQHDPCVEDDGRHNAEISLPPSLSQNESLINKN